MVDVLEEPFELGAALCPVALVLVARFQQQGVLPIEPIEALFAQRLHLGFSGAARADVQRLKVCQRLVGLGVVDGAQPPTAGGSGRALRRPWLHLQALLAACLQLTLVAVDLARFRVNAGQVRFHTVKVRLTRRLLARTAWKLHLPRIQAWDSAQLAMAQQGSFLVFLVGHNGSAEHRQRQVVAALAPCNTVVHHVGRHRARAVQFDHGTSVAQQDRQWRCAPSCQ